jgi:hypothetical protein
VEIVFCTIEGENNELNVATWQRFLCTEALFNEGSRILTEQLVEKPGDANEAHIDGARPNGEHHDLVDNFMAAC